MLGYDYEIFYKNGCDNVVVDALLHQFEEETIVQSFFLLIPDWIEEAHKEWFSHPSLSQFINNLREDINSSTYYAWKDDVLHYKDRVVISPNSTLKTHILDELLSSPIVGNSSF